MKLRILSISLFIFLSINASSQIVLMGDNAPFPNVNDGDFCAEWGYWRQQKQSPCWKTYAVEGKNQYKMGLDNGRLFSMHKIGGGLNRLSSTQIRNTSTRKLVMF